MIAPSKRMVVRALGKHALGALGAFALVVGAIVAVRDLGAGLALVVIGMGLLSICWGLTGRSWRATRLTTPLASRPALPAPPGRSPRPAAPPDGAGVPRAA